MYRPSIALLLIALSHVNCDKTCTKRASKLAKYANHYMPYTRFFLQSRQTPKANITGRSSAVFVTGVRSNRTETWIISQKTHNLSFHAYVLKASYLHEELTAQQSCSKEVVTSPIWYPLKTYWLLHFITVLRQHETTTNDNAAIQVPPSHNIIRRRTGKFFLDIVFHAGLTVPNNIFNKLQTHTDMPQFNSPTWCHQSMCWNSWLHSECNSNDNFSRLQ